MLSVLSQGIYNARTAALATAGKESADDRVVINVSGERYETCLGTLQRFPYTLLGRNPEFKSFVIFLSQQFIC